MADFPVEFSFQVLSVVLLGLALGSFSTALIYRIPENISWFSTEANRRSFCPRCKTILTPRDLVPVFSWLFSRGRCRHCQARIPLFYVCSELVVLGLVLLYAAFQKQTPWIMMVPFWGAIPFLWALFVVDMRTKTLPDQILGVLTGLGVFRCGLLLIFHQESFVDILRYYGAGALVFGGLAWGLGWCVSKIIKKSALGFGDVKFFGVAGLWLGITYLALFCILSGILGVVLGAFWQKITKERIFPFGPALILAFYVIFLLKNATLF